MRLSSSAAVCSAMLLREPALDRDRQSQHVGDAVRCRARFDLASPSRRASGVACACMWYLCARRVSCGPCLPVPPRAGERSERAYTCVLSRMTCAGPGAVCGGLPPHGRILVSLIFCHLCCTSLFSCASLRRGTFARPRARPAAAGGSRGIRIAIGSDGVGDREHSANTPRLRLSERLKLSRGRAVAPRSEIGWRWGSRSRVSGRASALQRYGDADGAVPSILCVVATYIVPRYLYLLLPVP